MVLDIFGMIIAFVISSIGIYIGLDLKKPAHWLFVASGFLIGLFMGLTRDDWASGIGLGIISSLLVVYTSVILRLQRQYISGAVKKLGLNEDSFNIFRKTKNKRKKSNTPGKRKLKRSTGKQRW